MNREIRMTIVGCIAIMLTITTAAQPNRGSRHRRMAFVTDTMMAHDPVMAYESQQAADGRPATEGTYFLLSTGIGIQWATSKDRKTWVVQPTPFIDTIPQWTHDSVPGFRNHVWAPDIIRWHNRWWLAYSCSTFGKNTSAIGLMTAASLSSTWKDEGCIVASQEGRDNWNAIEAPFILKHDGYYYLFVSWDYCCRGAKSNYRVAVGPAGLWRGRTLTATGATCATAAARSSWRATRWSMKPPATALPTTRCNGRTAKATAARRSSSVTATQRDRTVPPCSYRSPSSGLMTNGAS